MKKKNKRKRIIFLSLFLIIAGIITFYVCLAAPYLEFNNSSSEDLVESDYSKLNCQNMPKLDKYRTITKEVYYDTGYYKGFYIKYEPLDEEDSGDAYYDKVIKYFKENNYNYGYFKHGGLIDDKYIRDNGTTNLDYKKFTMVIETPTKLPFTTLDYYLTMTIRQYNNIYEFNLEYAVISGGKNVLRFGKLSNVVPRKYPM